MEQAGIEVQSVDFEQRVVMLTNEADRSVTVFQPSNLEDGWKFVGQIAQGQKTEGSPKGYILKDHSGSLLAPPIAWKYIWSSEHGTETSFWHPIPPPGYSTMGSIAVQQPHRCGAPQPELVQNFACVKTQLCQNANIRGGDVWFDHLNNNDRKLNLSSGMGTPFFVAHQVSGYADTISLLFKTAMY